MYTQLRFTQPTRNFLPQFRQNSVSKIEYVTIPSDSGSDTEFLFETRSRVRSALLWALCGGLLFIAVLLITVALLKGNLSGKSENILDDSSYETLTGSFEKAAVVSNAIPCASIGKTVLKKGGNAVDAMIATMLCDGVTMPQSMGIGGGFFMTIYNKTLNSFVTIDARETAPSGASTNMFHGKQNASQTGGLAVAVPGEMKGLWTAYQKFGGGVSWSDLVMPTIELCERGIPISPPLAMNLVKKRSSIEKNPEFRTLFTDPRTGRWFELGDTYKNLKLARTLRIIAEQGGDALYMGKMASSLVKDIQDAGGIITEEDLKNYRARIEEPLIMPIANGRFTMYSVKPPSSGAVLGYALRVLSDLLPAPNDLITTQRITEALKFAYAVRGELGDHTFVNVTQIVDKIRSDKFVSQVRQRIDDTRTWNDTAHYDLQAVATDDHGTANIVVLSESGDAVVASSTVNLIFGSKLISKSTGIVLNDEMDDFSSPNATNYFGLKPSEANFIAPGKRMMSSMCPSIITDHLGHVKLLIGGSGGSQITSGVAIAAARNLFLNETIRVALDNILFHHQLIPMKWKYFNNTPHDIIEGMKEIGHDVELSASTSFSAISAIEIKENNVVRGVCDRRRPGQIVGY